MYKTERVKDDVLEDYESHYNRRPKDSREISEKDFFEKLGSWNWDYLDNKQIREEKVYERATIFILYSQTAKTIGIYFSILPDGSRKYYEFGNWSQLYREQQKFFQ